MTRPPEKSGVDIIASIALQKISDHVRRVGTPFRPFTRSRLTCDQQQCGRLQRAPVTTLEIHVVSNRDRIGHQAFDLRFEQ